MPAMNCALCDLRVEKTQETMRAVYPWKPIIPEHVMFVPLRHFASLTEMAPEELADLIALIKQFKLAFYALSGKTGFNIFENDGPEAGQHVTHMHFHMFGRAVDEPVNPYHVLSLVKERPVRRLDDEEIRLQVVKLQSTLA